jgi:Domain of unknown function (DUF4136)
MNPFRPSRSRLCTTLLYLVLVVFLVSSPAFAKTTVDFNPNLDFSKYKTFAFIGGVENLLMLQLDPDVMDHHIHHEVSEQLVRKGLREVQPDQNPDLVVRYWANPSQQVNVTTMGNWAPYLPYINSDWAWIYNDVSASSAREGCLIVDLIEPRSKDLAWRLYLVRKIVNSEKDWRKTDEELAKAFESYPPSDSEKDAKKKERATHSPKSQ